MESIKKDKKKLERMLNIYKKALQERRVRSKALRLAFERNIAKIQHDISELDKLADITKDIPRSLTR